VTLGRIGSDSVQVLSGLSADDQVIVSGAAWVDDGAAVAVVDG
jgi:hypothetical protein